jgi:predicted site-specific integrase-resolvase
MKSTDELKDARATAKFCNVHPQLLRELARDGKIPSYRLSQRTLRFNVDEVKRCMKKIAEQERGQSPR